jgi:hypothetical protein
MSVARGSCRIVGMSLAINEDAPAQRCGYWRRGTGCSGRPRSVTSGAADHGDETLSIRGVDGSTFDGNRHLTDRQSWNALSGPYRNLLGMSRAEPVDNTPHVAIASPNLPRVYDEPFRSAPHKKERIAGHQCQVAPGSTGQHANSGRPNDLGFRDLVPRCTVIHEDAPDQYHVTENIQTPKGARNMGLDPSNHRVFIVSAKFGTPPPGGKGRGPVLPGSFALMVIERNPAMR